MRTKVRKLTSILLAVFMAFSLFTIAPITASAATSGDFEYKVLNDGTAEITKYKGYAKTLTIPSELDGYTVTCIGDWAFYYCHLLESVTIPDSVTSISSGAFIECSRLESVTIPDSVTSIGNSVFSECTSLRSITIPNSVTSIGMYAFYGTCITSVRIPGSVKTIGEYAFGYYYENTDIKISGFRITGYSDTAAETYAKENSFAFIDLGPVRVTSGNYEYVMLDDGTVEIARYKGNALTLTIPSELDGYTVTSIGKLAFCSHIYLESVTIPDSVKSIGTAAFRDCGRLESVTIPNSVTSIGWEAFKDCISLNSITIPDSVTSIDSHAFYGTGIASVTIPSSVTTIGEYAFGYYYENTDEKFFGFTITGYSGTAAESYANENEFEFVSLGNAINDVKTDISVTIKNQAELSVEKLTDAESINKANVALKDNGNLIDLYDISLIKDGAPVQPDGTATVKIPTDNENAKVYRIEDDGTATDMNAVYSGGYMVFTTEHFSTYALVVPNDVIIGDANGDGEVNVLDVSTIQLHVAKMTAPEIVTEACDVDGDGDINVNDVSLLQMKIAKLIP